MKIARIGFVFVCGLSFLSADLWAWSNICNTKCPDSVFSGSLECKAFKEINCKDSSSANSPAATDIPSPTLPTPIGGKARVSLGGGGASASAFLMSRRLTIKSEAWSDSVRKGTKASVQVVISDKSGKQIYASSSYDIPTACSKLDRCPSRTSQRWDVFIPAGMEYPNASSLAVYLRGR